MATTRPYHHGNLRTALLDSAEEMLAESGAGALSLREVARRVGVSHAAPRRHFADRQALLDALAERGYERLGHALAEGMAGETGFEARLRAFAHAYVRFASGHAALIELMFAGKHREGADDVLAGAAERAFAAPLNAVLEAQAAGEVVAGDPERVATVVLAALQGLASLVSMGMLDAAQLDTIVADAVERLIYGLRPRGPFER